MLLNQRITIELTDCESREFLQLLRDCKNIIATKQTSASQKDTVDEISISSAAKLYEVSPGSFYNWAKKGIITIKKMGGRSYVSKAEISTAMSSLKSVN
jgi:hypothetical protein